MPEQYSPHVFWITIHVLMAHFPYFLHEIIAFYSTRTLISLQICFRIPEEASRCQTRGESEESIAGEEACLPGIHLSLEPKADVTRSPKQGISDVIQLKKE